MDGNIQDIFRDGFECDLFLLKVNDETIVACLECLLWPRYPLDNFWWGARHIGWLGNLSITFSSLEKKDARARVTNYFLPNLDPGSFCRIYGVKIQKGTWFACGFRCVNKGKHPWRLALHSLKGNAWGWVDWVFMIIARLPSSFCLQIPKSYLHHHHHQEIM